MSRDGYASTVQSSARARARVRSPRGSASTQLQQSDLAGHSWDHMQGKNIHTSKKTNMQGSHFVDVQTASNEASGSSSSQPSPDADGGEEADSAGDEDNDEDDEEAEHIAPFGEPTTTSNRTKSKKTNDKSLSAKPSVSWTGPGVCKNEPIVSKGLKRRRDHSPGAAETNGQGDCNDSMLRADQPVRKKMLIKKNQPYGFSDVVSDDDDYAAVELISDSEGDDPDVEKLEEKQIIDEERLHAKRKQSFSSICSGVTDLAQGLILSDMPFYDFELQCDETAFASALLPTPNIEPQFRERCESSARRVRFEDQLSGSAMSNSGDSDLRSDLFPDIYVQSSSLGFSIENGDEAGSVDNSGSDSEGSYWDLKSGNLELDKLDGQDVPSDSEDSDNSSSDHESQAGDTTDEDVPVPATISRPSSLLRRQLSSSAPEQGANSRATQLRSVPPSRRKGPIMGSWAIDRSQAVAVIDNTGKRMVLIPARVPRSMMSSHLWSNGSASSSSSIAQSSPQNSFCTLARTDSEMTENSQNLVDPMDIMTNGVFRTAAGNELFIGSPLLGQRRPLYSVQYGDKSQVRDLENEDADADEESDGEDMLNIEDFIDFGDTSDSDAEQEGLGDVSMASFSKASTSGSAAPITATRLNVSGNASMLSHLGHGKVTAFRRHQNSYRQASGLPQHPAMRASIMDNNALQAGRANIANSPITPPRKRRQSKGGARDGGIYAAVSRRQHGRVTSTS